ncbi:hypothetical protein JS533_007860 [Bifidobacterium amazonense]|uniref:Uncharacterized protein n=1 Tax=Bifidobacterium amazonense TaxID=2809027 RepID=A0ABS9VW50_9BIFI|nr:hypothetical protein [Bifidobacterium amazonense]MCH9276184.1 hypothetical protein [Bifidobacterium amazonense]
MASLLQGFEEVQLVKPLGKTVLTVTDSAIRFNKATAEALGFPTYAKVLINDRTKQIAVTPATAKSDNAVKFSKPDGKQVASISVKDATVVAAVSKYFTLQEAPEGEIAYESIVGTPYQSDKVVIFSVADATSGTMKRRGRKKADKSESVEE